MTREMEDDKVRTFTTNPVQRTIGFPGLIGIAIEEPFERVFLAGVVGDPMIYRWIGRIEPVLIRRYSFTWESCLSY